MFVLRQEKQMIYIGKMPCCKIYGKELLRFSILNNLKSLSIPQKRCPSE